MAEKENEQPRKKRRLSLSLKGKQAKALGNLSAGRRFITVDEGDLETAAEGVMPTNTKKNNTWAARNFSEWAETRNSSNPLNRVPDDLLSCINPETVSTWLCRFVMETRQQSGKPYPPKSIYSILCGLYRISKSNGVPFNFLDKSDTRFVVLHNTLDSLFSRLHSEGVGAFKKSASVITVQDEDLFWESKIMSIDSPKGLQNLVFYYVGIHFCLRGVQEQHDLTVEQFKRSPADPKVYDDNTYYEYVELISKNNQHRFKNIHSKNKTVKVHAMIGCVKCFVKILDFYFTKLPPDPKAFYLRPHTNRPLDSGKPWYINVPVGVNTLKTILPKMSEEAGASVRYTNHSLRATSASRLFASGIPEKVIQEKTGHHSLAGLRAYEKTTSTQERTVTKILTSTQLFQNPKVVDTKHEEQLELLQDVEKGKKEHSTLFSGDLHNCVFNFHS